MRAELFAAVRAEPGDDAARAVLADWLQERGDPLGQFISLQLATHGRTPSSGERKVMHSLLFAHRRKWLGDLGSIVAPNRLRFSRGFLSEVAVSPDNLGRLATSAHAATIEAVWLETPGQLDAALLHAPNLRALRFVGGIEPFSMLEQFEASGPFAFDGVGVDLFHVLPQPGRTWLPHQLAMRERVARLHEIFPRCRELAVRAWYRDRDPEHLSFLWTSPIAERLERLRLSTVLAPYWINHQDTLPASITLLESSFDFGFHGWALEVLRDEHGRLSRVVATARPALKGFDAVSLDDLVGDLLDGVDVNALTSLEVRADRVRVTRRALDSIVAAARRHVRLATLRLPGRKMR